MLKAHITLWDRQLHKANSFIGMKICPIHLDTRIIFYLGFLLCQNNALIDSQFNTLKFRKL